MKSLDLRSLRGAAGRAQPRLLRHSLRGRCEPGPDRWPPDGNARTFGLEARCRICRGRCGDARQMRARHRTRGHASDIVGPAVTGFTPSTYRPPPPLSRLSDRRLRQAWQPCHSSRSGAADVQSELGIDVMAGPTATERPVRGRDRFHDGSDTPPGDAPCRHGTELGCKTIFNILGPLTNPAGVKRQLTECLRPRPDLADGRNVADAGHRKGLAGAWLGRNGRDHDHRRDRGGCAGKRQDPSDPPRGCGPAGASAP